MRISEIGAKVVLAGISPAIYIGAMTTIAVATIGTAIVFRIGDRIHPIVEIVLPRRTRESAKETRR